MQGLGHTQFPKDFSIQYSAIIFAILTPPHVTRDSLNIISEMMLYCLPSDDRFPFQGKK